ncbi:AglZ/HisF2 family acetamidino modification protein [Alphaproteobacteria bacterium]|nr:AglZ/HisF2 family acetamidino modification protein [Alphaproteobacteria bacterium]
MFRPRLIPVLLIDDGILVKTKKFKSGVYIGDPINAVKIFNDLRADELIFLDISASKNKKTIPLDLIETVGEESNMPFSVGGGIRTIEDIKKIINSGAERVVLSSVACENPKFIKEASDYFGSSTIAVCLDIKKDFFGNYSIYYKNGKLKLNSPYLDFITKLEALGAGEIVIQSISNDGMMLGYDLNLLNKISSILSIPLVALGGAGTMSDFKDVYKNGFVNGIAAGSMFVFHGKDDGVLINYPSKKEIINLFK